MCKSYIRISLRCYFFPIGVGRNVNSLHFGHFIAMAVFSFVYVYFFLHYNIVLTKNVNCVVCIYDVAGVETTVVIVFYQLWRQTTLALRPLFFLSFQFQSIGQGRLRFL